MSRRIVFISAGLISALGATLALTTQSADASDGTCKQIYSTGPIENAIGLGVIGPPVSEKVFVKALNNDEWNDTNVEIKVFKLNGHKELLGSETLHIGPQASGFERFDVSGAFEWEVQATVTGDARKRTLLGVFGKDSDGNLVAAQRLVHTELSQKKENCFD